MSTRRGSAAPRSRYRRPLCIDEDTTILDASRMMRVYKTGELVVTHQPDGTRIPVGLVSARDIVTRIVAAGLDPAVLTAGDISWFGTEEPWTAAGIADTLREMKRMGSRYLPLVDRDGGLTGFVAVDELIDAIDEPR